MEAPGLATYAPHRTRAAATERPAFADAQPTVALATAGPCPTDAAAHVAPVSPVTSAAALASALACRRAPLMRAGLGYVARRRTAVAELLRAASWLAAVRRTTNATAADSVHVRRPFLSTAGAPASPTAPAARAAAHRLTHACARAAAVTAGVPATTPKATQLTAERAARIAARAAGALWAAATAGPGARATC